MSNKLISLEAVGNASLVVPSSLSDSAITSSVIPFVVPIIKALARTTGQVVQVVAKQIHESQWQLSFYDKVGKVIETEVLPIIAEAEALQLGLDYINRRGYDPRVFRRAERRLLKNIEE